MQHTNMTSNNELISVIVPVYKVEAYLDKCVQSIVSQTYSNLEIILVDDGSPDKCPAMCDVWAGRDPRIKVIHKSNGGLSDARNAGMAVAKGEFIAFVDSDDWIAPEMMEKLSAAMQRDDSDIAACAVEMIWEDDTPNRLLTVRTNCVLDNHQAQEALLKETTLKQPVWYKLYRRETIVGIPFEVGKYHEDVFWSYQAIGNARRVSVIDYTGYFYLQRKGSIMGEGYSLKRLDGIEAKVQRQEYLEREMPELAENGRVNLAFSCIYNGQLALRHMNKTEQDQAFYQLRETMRNYPLGKAELAHLRLIHQIWYRMAIVSLRSACRVRNILGVGK